MANENWQQVKNIFNVALQQKPEERLQFLERACEDDETRREVESLLVSFDDSESFLESPAIGEVTEVIESNGKKLEKGQGFGHYEIVKQIGAGGMGEVYLAKDKKLDRKVAIKILNEKFNRHQSNLERFVREAKSASGLNHPNILVIHEIGELEDANYIVSEFVEGKTLREIISESSMKLSEVLDISIQIANALTVAHAAHIIHRDIKPENIMIRPDGFVKILDFGLAKLVEQKNKSLIGLEEETVKQNQTAKGIILGTVNYMSPEQAKGERVDQRTDIFSLGVVIYEMIAGRTPFAGDSMSETFANLINAEPLPLSRFATNIPNELQRIVSKTLRKNKDERYQTAKDLLLDLKDVKQKSESQNKLRTTTPHPEESKTQTINETTTKDASHKTSSAEYLIGEIKSHKFGFAVGLVILLLASISLGYLFFAGRLSFAAPIESIAVLPFENASGDANLDYLSDGMSESLIDRLSGLPQLKVIARNSSFKYRGQNVDLPEAAAKLGVQAIVTGRITQRGENLLIRVEMIDTRENRQLWSEQFNRKATDALAFQEEIARTASEKLRLKLSGAEEQKLAKNYTENAEAYQLYLRGHFLQYKITPQDLYKSIEFYQQAVALDPNFALVYVGLAESTGRLTAFRDIPQRNYMQMAREYALKAVSLDDQLPEAHATLGSILFLYDYDPAGAEREYQRSLELNPNYSEVHLWHGRLLSSLGRHEEALAEIRRAMELDPMSLQANSAYGEALFFARRYDESIAHLKKVVNLDANYFPAHRYLAFNYEMKGDYAARIAESVKLNEITNSRERGEAMQKSFERSGWQGFLRDATADNSPFDLHGYLLATFCAELGNKDKAFAILEKLYKEREGELVHIKVDPRLDNLRDDARFQDLMRRVGLPQ